MRQMGFRIDTKSEEEKAHKLVLPCDFQHAICIGMTGSGKTASLILPVMEERLKRGYGILAYTYKGHEHRKIKYLAKEAGRLEDVIEIGKPHGQYINLMASFELNALKKTLEELISGSNSNGDSYWTLSAARLGVNIVDILRKLHKVETIVKNEIGNTSQLRRITLKEKEDDTHSVFKYEYPKGEPSFKTLAEIVKSPKTLKRFYAGLDQLVKNIRNTITGQDDDFYGTEKKEYVLFFDDDEILVEEERKKKISESFVRKVALGLLRLEETIAPYKDFTIDVKSNDGSGNNGVLQVLNNAVLNLSNKDYINIGDVDLLESLNQNAIVIVDIEGIESDIHGVLLESILSKLSARIRNGMPPPVSVFVDESNRVLHGEMDIHNDTLRESNVELILAAQNEEQLIEKFGLVKWESIRKNFKHNYWIDQKHHITYNDGDTWKSEALIISPESLLEAEYAFNTLEKNRKIFENRFTYEYELPMRFIVEYDILNFEKEMSMYLVDEKLNRKEIEYMGKELKQKFESAMLSLGYDQDFGINLKLKI